MSDEVRKILKQVVRAEMVYHKDVRVQDRFFYVANVYLERNGLELSPFLLFHIFCDVKSTSSYSDYFIFLIKDRCTMCMPDPT